MRDWVSVVNRKLMLLTGATSFVALRALTLPGPGARVPKRVRESYRADPGMGKRFSGLLRFPWVQMKSFGPDRLAGQEYVGLLGWLGDAHAPAA